MSCKIEIRSQIGSIDLIYNKYLNFNQKKFLEYIGYSFLLNLLEKIKKKTQFNYNFLIFFFIKSKPVWKIWLVFTPSYHLVYECFWFVKNVMKRKTQGGWWTIFAKWKKIVTYWIPNSKLYQMQTMQSKNIWW